jgi:hypothetical protein
MKTREAARRAEALPGSGGLLKESLEIARSLPDIAVTRVGELNAEIERRMREPASG